MIIEHSTREIAIVLLNKTSEVEWATVDQINAPEHQKPPK